MGWIAVSHVLPVEIDATKRERERGAACDLQRQFLWRSDHDPPCSVAGGTFCTTATAEAAGRWDELAPAAKLPALLASACSFLICTAFLRFSRPASALYQNG